MNPKELVVLLNDIKKNRRLSGESTAMIKPFIGMYLSFTFIFESVSSTFSQKYGTHYDKGKTVVAKIINSELKCCVLFSPDQNDWLSTLSSGYKFTKEVLVLGLDNLHGRVIFGYSEKTQEIPKASECSTELTIDRIVPDREKIQEIGESENLHPSSLQKRRLFRRKKHLTKVFNKAQKISLKLKGGKKLRLPYLKSRLRSVTLKNSGKKTNQDNKAQKISLKLKGGKKLRLPYLKSRLRSVILRNSGKKTNQDNKAQKISLKLKGGKKLRLPHLKSRLRSVTLKNSGKKTNQDGASPIPIAQEHSQLKEGWMVFCMILGGLVLLYGIYSEFMHWYSPTPCIICKSTEGYREEGSKYDNRFFFCKSCGHKYDRHP